MIFFINRQLKYFFDENTESFKAYQLKIEGEELRTIFKKYYFGQDQIDTYEK